MNTYTKFGHPILLFCSNETRPFLQFTQWFDGSWKCVMQDSALCHKPIVSWAESFPTATDFGRILHKKNSFHAYVYIHIYSNRIWNIHYTQSVKLLNKWFKNIINHIIVQNIEMYIRLIQTWSHIHCKHIDTF